MVLAVKEFKVPMVSSVGETVQGAAQESSNNMLVLQMFYDTSWGKTTRDMLLWFNGGSGHGLETLAYARPAHVVKKGVVYFNCSSFAPSQHPMDFKSIPQMPIHDFIRYAFEVESFIAFICEKLLKNKVAAQYINQDSSMVLAGSSRGAGNILQWSNLSRAMYPKYRHKVVGLVANSPAGGNTSQRWNGPYIAQRATYKFFQNVMHPTLACFGAGDVTHTNRAHVERIQRSISNPLVKIRVEGDDEWGHSWPNLARGGAYRIFLDHALAFLKN